MVQLLFSLVSDQVTEVSIIRNEWILQRQCSRLHVVHSIPIVETSLGIIPHMLSAQHHHKTLIGLPHNFQRPTNRIKKLQLAKQQETI